MSAFTDKRAEIQSELSSLAAELEQQLADAGAALLESGILPNEEPYASLVSEEAQASARVEEMQEKRARIVAIGERLAAIESAIQELEKRGKDISGELAPHYRTIGENAFRVFRDNPLIDQEYADIFTPVLNSAEEIRGTRSELEQAESELAEKPFLEKMVLSGRIIVLRNRLALRETQMERLYREAGRQISATDFITTIGDPGLDEAAAPFLDLMDESKRIEHEIAMLEQERTSLREELGSLGVERRPATRLSELDEQMAGAMARRKLFRAEIATAAKGSGLLDSAGDDVQRRLETVEKIEQDQKKARRKLESIDAAIRVEQLSEEIDHIESAAERKRTQVKTLAEEIEALETRKAGLEGQVAEAAKTRGPVEKLLN
ncbi:MAG: hypothetical protein ACOC2N_03910 [Spirochaetota bacterium]